MFTIGTKALLASIALLVLSVEGTPLAFELVVERGYFCGRDVWDASDPYASAWLVSGNTRIKSLGKSDIVENSNTPVFNWKSNIGEFTKSEFENMRIEFDIADWDKNSADDNLGKGYSTNLVFLPGKRPYGVTLHGGCSHPEVFFQIIGSPVVVPLPFDLVVVRGDFCSQDFWGAASDPYASAWLVAGNTRIKSLGRSTRHDNNNSPVFNWKSHLGTYTKTEFENMRIEFDIADWDENSADDNLGKGYSPNLRFLHGRNNYGVTLHGGCSHPEIYYQIIGPDPTPKPTPFPTPVPSESPTTLPTTLPTIDPTPKPTPFPTPVPSELPTTLPTIAAPSPVKTYGDPHFKTWSGEVYDFHGTCDLVFLRNPDFANGLGMDINIRSARYRQMWSYIDTTVVRIGEDILEVKGGKGSKHFLVNGVEADFSGTEQFTLSGYPISHKAKDEKANTFTIDLVSKNGDKIIIKTWNAMVSVDIENASEENFGSSVGMLGEFNTGRKLDREGNLMVGDLNKFGQEWQVMASEPNLFHESQGTVQAPLKCQIPSSGEMRRRLARASISVEEAEVACAHVSPDDFEMCIF